MFEELGLELEQAKMQVKLAKQDLDELKVLQALETRTTFKLRAIHVDEPRTKIKSIIPKDDAAENSLKQTQNDRFILDAIQLQQRAIECKEIKEIVFEKIREVTRGLSFDEVRMADIKEMPRAHTKLQD